MRTGQGERLMLKRVSLLCLLCTMVAPYAGAEMVASVQVVNSGESRMSAVNTNGLFTPAPSALKAVPTTTLLPVLPSDSQVLAASKVKLRAVKGIITQPCVDKGCTALSMVTRCVADVNAKGGVTCL